MARKFYAAANFIQGFGLNMFSDDELYSIHLATLEVLQKMTINFAQETLVSRTSVCYN